MPLFDAETKHRNAPAWVPRPTIKAGTARDAVNQIVKTVWPAARHWHVLSRQTGRETAERTYAVMLYDEHNQQFAEWVRVRPARERKIVSVIDPRAGPDV